MYQLDPKTKTPVPDDDTLYPYINNDIEYRLFEDIVDSYYLDSQIKDDFQCDHNCYSHQWESTVDDHSISCTHAYDHIVQHIQNLSDSTQQHTLHSMEEKVSLFTDDAATPCDFNITNLNLVTENTKDTSSIMILTIKTHLHSQTNTPHYYNKNYKIHIGVCITLSQLKVIKFQKIWTLRLCHMQCISPAIQIQSQRSITFHIKQ